MRVELLGHLCRVGPCGIKIGDKVGAPPAIAEGLVPWGGSGSPAGPFPLRLRRDLKAGAEGSLWCLCNLTHHVTWKFGDSVRGVEKSAFALRGKVGEEKLGTLLVVSVS